MTPQREYTHPIKWYADPDIAGDLYINATTLYAEIKRGLPAFKQNVEHENGTISRHWVIAESTIKTYKEYILKHHKQK